MKITVPIGNLKPGLSPFDISQDVTTIDFVSSLRSVPSDHAVCLSDDDNMDG